MYIDNIKYRKITRDRWMLTEDWVTPYGTIPKHFQFNGADVPKFLHWFTKPDGMFFVASVVHDWHLKKGIGSKILADWRFFKASRLTGVSLPTAVVAYLGVVVMSKGNFK